MELASVAKTTGAVLHVGCGGSPLPEWLSGDEVRLDLDPSHNPDIVASITDLGEIGPFATVFASHTLEHVFPHEVEKALLEFHRVLLEGGCAVIVVPDLEGVSPTFDILYESSAGPVTGFDLFYGMARLTQTNPLMSHKSGFVRDTLEMALRGAGFREVVTYRDRTAYNLVGVAKK